MQLLAGCLPVSVAGHGSASISMPPPWLCWLQEAWLAQERDAACKEAAQLRAERETLSAMVQQLEDSARELTAQLQAEQARAASAAQAAARHQVRRLPLPWGGQALVMC